MYQITKASIDVLSLPKLYRVRDAVKELQGLGVWEVDVDTRQYIDGVISKKEQSRI